MEPELADLLAKFEIIATDSEALTAPLSDAQLLWKPGADQWPIAECFAHLVAVDGKDIPGLRAEIAAARRNGITGRGPSVAGTSSVRCAVVQPRR